MPADDETMFLACLLELGRPPKEADSEKAVGFYIYSDRIEAWYKIFESWYHIHFNTDRRTQYEWEHKYLTWIKKQST